MRKSAFHYSPSSATTHSVKGALKSVGAGALIGAPVGAYMVHRQTKFTKGEKKKATKKALIGGAVFGGLAGASTNAYIYNRLGEGERFSPARVKRLLNYAKKEGIKIKGRHAPIIGAAAGGVGGAGLGYARQKFENKHTKKKKDRLDPRAAAALYGMAGAQFGAAVGYHSRKMGLGDLSFRKSMNQAEKTMPWRVKRTVGRWRKKWTAGAAGASWRAGSSHARAAPAPAAVPEWLKGVTTKADAKKRWRAKAYEHHPDRGGNETAFKNLANQWSDFEVHHFDKLASRRFHFFVDELMKIAEVL